MAAFATVAGHAARVSWWCDDPREGMCQNPLAGEKPMRMDGALLLVFGASDGMEEYQYKSTTQQASKDPPRS